MDDVWECRGDFGMTVKGCVAVSLFMASDLSFGKGTFDVGLGDNVEIPGDRLLYDPRLPEEVEMCWG